KSVRLWDTESGKEMGEAMRGHTSGVNSVAFSPDGRRIVSGSSDMSIRVWNAENSKGIEEHLEERIPPYFCFHHYHHSQLPFTTFHINTEGWLCGADPSCGSNSALLLWIPPEYRQSLIVPPMQLLISTTGQTTLDLHNFVHGVEWARCYAEGE
ncbi:hypothetical protein BDP27DRAFT_1231516, partial [Rhodocollybia butyracea]